MANECFYEQEDGIVIGTLKFEENTIPSENLPLTLSIR